MLELGGRDKRSERVIVGLAEELDAAGLGEAAAEDLARCGKSGKKYISVQDLGSDCPKVSQTHLDTLRSLGALGDLPDSNQINLFDL